MPFEINPIKLVYGGEALGHAEGKTILIPGVLPGERAEAEEVRTSKGVTHARLLRILEPAPERVAPPCPYFGVCGGCHYQHLSAAGQTRWKTEIVRETLRRIGKINWTADIPVHQAEPWRYRNQAELKVATGAAGGLEIGFFQAESHRLVPINECLILSPLLNTILAALRKRENLARLSGCRSIELLADDRDEKAAITFRGGFDQATSTEFARTIIGQIAGVVSVSFDEGAGLQTFGEEAVLYRVGEGDYRISSGSFFQASRFLIAELLKAATANQGGALAIDLYAGVGLFSLALARQFERVIAVESNPAAARDLASNGQSAGAANLRVEAQSAYDFLRRFAQPDADLVLLDPPRAGVGKPTLERLAHLRPKRLHYVSCHPPTWARDLAALIKEGYRIESVEMFDFFPQTYHIEVLARLSKSE